MALEFPRLEEFRAQLRGGMPRPRGRTPERLRACKTAVRGADSPQTALEFLVARGLLPESWTTGQVFSFVQLKPSGKPPKASYFAYLAADWQGAETAIALAHEAAARASAFGWVPPRGPVSIGLYTSFELSRRINAVQTDIHVDGDEGGFSVVSVGINNAIREQERSEIWDIVRSVTPLYSVQVIVATSLAWDVLAGRKSRDGILFAEHANPFEPLVDMLLLGYWVGYAPTKTWLCVSLPLANL